MNDEERRYPKAAYAAMAFVGAVIAGAILAGCIIGVGFAVVVVWP